MTNPAGPCPTTGDKPATQTAFRGLEKKIARLFSVGSKIIFCAAVPSMVLELNQLSGCVNFT